MAKLGERTGVRISGDEGFKKISDVLTAVNEEIECILIGIETKQARDGRDYKIFRVFDPEEGEIQFTSGGSCLEKAMEKSIAAKLFNPFDMPAIVIGVENIRSYAAQSGPNQGEMVDYHVVYVEALKENAAIANLRMRARMEMSSGHNDSPPPSRPAPTRALNSPSQQFQAEADDLDAVFASEDELPF